MIDLLNWRDGLAPGHARDTDGELLVGGVRADELAARYGTPLLALDLDAFDAAIAAFVDACSPRDVEVAYAGKALLLVAIARHLVGTPLQLDVCSLGELATAERAGFPAARLTLHGCGKSAAELDAVAQGRVGTIVADSLEEIERLASRASATWPIRVAVRVNTGIEAHTHEFVRTGGGNTKFGVPFGDLDAVIGALHAATGLHYAGLHSHVGSQIYEAATFAENVRALVEIAVRFGRAGLRSELLIVGGGFGIQDNPAGAATIDIATTIATIVKALDEAIAATGIPRPRLGIEPGRALIGRAGTSIYRVMARKQQSKRAFVVVDGSLSDNPRPALYGAYHHTAAATARAGAGGEVTLCGRSCENDVLGEARLPVDLRGGDLVAMCTTGAYTYSMAGNYNRFAKPAVVAVRQGSHRLFARRQTLDDVLGEDCDV